MFILKSTHDAAVARLSTERDEARKLIDKLYAELARETKRANGFAADLAKFTGPRDRASNGRFLRSVGA